jgi:hypothetical protein
MNGSMDANELAGHLLEGLGTLEVGPMLRSELARRLAELGIAAPPPPPAVPPRRHGIGAYRSAFLRSIEVASGGELRVAVRFVRSRLDAAGYFRLSYSGAEQRRWSEVIERDGPAAFAKRVLQVLEGEMGGGFEVAFGVSRTSSKTISLMAAGAAADASDRVRPRYPARFRRRA